jgi:hypothetical protein
MVAAPVLLGDGRVLLVGADATGPAAAVFDPATAIFACVGAPTVVRGDAASVLLRDGRVLVSGGEMGWDREAPIVTDTADLFDPQALAFTSTSPGPPPAMPSVGPCEGGG